MTRARARGPVLVLVLDHVGRGDFDLRRDIEALTSNAFGPGVRVVLAADEGSVSALLRKAVGRGPSALAPRAKRVVVGPLSHTEFGAAVQSLAEDRIGFLSGAQYSPELRHPWILRAIVGDVHASPNHSDPALSAALSPQPGLDLLHKVREDFDIDAPPMSLYGELAQALLADIEAGPRLAHALQLLGGYLIRRESLLAHLSGDEVKDLVAAGLIVATRTEADENAYAVRLPQLLASELAKLLAQRLVQASNGAPDDTADWLLNVTGGLLLGDIIAAQALLDAATRHGRLGVDLITTLVNRPPVKEVLAPGTKVGAWIEGAGAFMMTLLEAGAVRFEKDGESLIAEADSDGPTEHLAWKDHQPWLILSRLAGRPFLIAKDGQALGRGDMALLLHIGACPITLIEPGGDIDIRSLPIHQLGPDLSIVCHKAGLVEPITWSMFTFLSENWAQVGDTYVKAALDAAAPALLPRLDLCLRLLGGLDMPERQTWAHAAHARVAPALEAALPETVHD